MKRRGLPREDRSERGMETSWDLRPISSKVACPRWLAARRAKLQEDANRRGNPMMRALIAVAAVLSLAAPASAADKYTVTDKGGFGSTGRLVEFASRYGWHSYEVDFDFGVDLSERRLTRKSKLTVKIQRNDGSTWKYRCRAKDQRWMWANINRLYDKGISVLTECRIDPDDFAEAVDLESDLVGDLFLVQQGAVGGGMEIH
ncbi:hypothetical protein ACFL2T_08035, partial [Elusimicrobiota bacterium]